MAVNKEFGKLLKQYRVAADLTLQELSDKAGVSPSHLGRIENAQRFPSGHILQRIAGPLGLSEDDIFVKAGYLSPLSPRAAGVAEKAAGYGAAGRLDPYVAEVLGRESVEVQRSVVGILEMLKNIARGLESGGK